MNKQSIEQASTKTRLKTPQNRPTLPEPIAPYKRKLRKFSNLKKIQDEDSMSDIVLFDGTKKKFKCYRVYDDQKIGVNLEYQNMLRKTIRDNDCDSQDGDVAEAVVNLWKSLKKKIENLKIN